MQTLLVQDGDVVIDPATGLQLLVADSSKANQDVAEELLTEYNAYFDVGNELLSLASNYSSTGLSTALAYQYLYDCVNRLITSQKINNLDQQIIKILEIQTQLVGLSTLVFLVQVLFDDGGIVSVVDKVQMQTSLNQTINLNGLVGV
jgi:hypothetical protein